MNAILLSFGCSSLARPFWRHSALRRHGLVDCFLCDCPPATNYRDAEPQDVFNVHLTNFNHLAELTHKKGDFFPLVSKLVAHVHGHHTKPRDLTGQNAVKHEMDSISACSFSYAGTKGDETPVSHCLINNSLQVVWQWDPHINLENTKQECIRAICFPV